MRAFLEVVAADRHGVGHVRQADDLALPGLGVRVERGGFHLDDVAARRAGFVDGALALSERGVRSPCRTGAYRLGETVVGVFELLTKVRAQVAPGRGRQVVQAGSLVAP